MWPLEGKALVAPTKQHQDTITKQIDHNIHQFIKIMNRKSIYATLFLTFLLGIGGQTALAHTGGSDAGYRDNQTAASLIQTGEAEGAKILAAQAETSLLHLDEDAVLYATIANQSEAMMARPAVVCTWNGKLVGKTVLTEGLKGLDQQTVAIHISAADLDKVLGEDAKKGAIRLELELIDEAQPLKTACSASYVNITRAESFYTRRMVVEEGTGAWCGWCVKGIVGLRYMNATYPDQFIGIAVHNGDMYTVNNYKTWLAKYFDGYPNCLANRSGKAFIPEAANLERRLKAMDEKAECDIQFTAQLADGTISFHTTTTFLTTKQESNYRMAYVVCEDQLPITQNNYYAGGENGEMGGFEDLPKKAEIKVDDVALGIYPSPEGMEDVLPQTIEAEQAYEHAYSIDAPYHDEDDNLWAAVLLIDGATGEIVQAAKAKVLPATSIQGVADQPATTPREGIFNLQGQRLRSLQQGINIVNGKKVLKR